MTRNNIMQVPGFRDRFKPHTILRHNLILTTGGVQERHAQVYFAVPRNSNFPNVILKCHELGSAPFVVKFRTHIAAHRFYDNFSQSHMDEQLMRDYFMTATARWKEDAVEARAIKKHMERNNG